MLDWNLWGTPPRCWLVCGDKEEYTISVSTPTYPQNEMRPPEKSGLWLLGYASILDIIPIKIQQIGEVEWVDSAKDGS
jgi:hypothetical protein